MAILERVAEELAEAREEGFALAGPDFDVVEKEEEKVRSHTRARVCVYLYIIFIKTYGWICLYQCRRAID